MFDGVTAVGEAKLALTTGHCDLAFEIATKIAKCKLHADNNNMLVNECYSAHPVPPFFLLALNSNVALTTLESKMCNDLFQCAIVFAQDDVVSAVAVSSVASSSAALAFLDKIGKRAPETSRVYLVDNPLLVFSWMLATYSVPMISLTPIIPMYF